MKVTNLISKCQSIPIANLPSLNVCRSSRVSKTTLNTSEVIWYRLCSLSTRIHSIRSSLPRRSRKTVTDHLRVVVGAAGASPVRVCAPRRASIFRVWVHRPTRACAPVKGILATRPTRLSYRIRVLRWLVNKSLRSLEPQGWDLCQEYTFSLGQTLSGMSASTRVPSCPTSSSRLLQAWSTSTKFIRSSRF